MSSPIRIMRWLASIAASVALAATSVAANAETDLVVQGGSPSPTYGYVPIYIAQDAGFFKDAGLNVEVRYSRGAALATQIVSTGGADIGSMTVDPVLLGYSKGVRGKFFYGLYNRVIYFIGVPEDSSIHSVKDLAGKKIGVSSMGSASLVVAKSMLRQAGMQPDAVTFVPVGIGATAVAALKSGQIQALSLWDAAYAGIEGLGVHLRYIHHPKIGNISSGGYFASTEALQNKSDALAGYARAISKALVFLKANPEAAARIFWKRSPSAKQGATEEEALKKTVASLEFVASGFYPEQGKPYGYIDPKDIELYASILHEEGVLKAPVPAEAISTNKYVKQANEFDADKIREMARDWK